MRRTPWLRLNADFADHPKVVGLSDAAIAAWVRALCYCGQHRTDGLVPWGHARRIAKPKIRSELVDAQLWHPDGDDGIRIHNYLAYQASAAEFDAQHAARSEAGRRGAEKRWQTDSKRHSRSHS